MSGQAGPGVPGGERVLGDVVAARGGRAAVGARGGGEPGLPRQVLDARALPQQHRAALAAVHGSVLVSLRCNSLRKPQLLK